MNQVPGLCPGDSYYTRQIKAHNYLYTPLIYCIANVLVMIYIYWLPLKYIHVLYGKLIYMYIWQGMEHSVNSVELMSKQIYNTVIFSYGNVLHGIGH